MAVFPLFVDLKDKRCVVIGGGKVAERKINSLLEFGARITVVSPEVTEGIQELKWQGRLVVIKKRYSEDDLEAEFIVIAATSDAKVNGKVFNDAVKNNIMFINVADCPEKCTFIFPSIVKRDELVIGISTSGSYPALSMRIRQKIEETVPQSCGTMLKTLKECRKRADAQIQSTQKKKELMNKILDEVVFYEDAVTSEQLEHRIEDIFEEYKDEKDY